MYYFNLLIKWESSSQLAVNLERCRNFVFVTLLFGWCYRCLLEEAETKWTLLLWRLQPVHLLSETVLSAVSNGHETASVNMRQGQTGARTIFMEQDTNRGDGWDEGSNPRRRGTAEKWHVYRFTWFWQLTISCLRLQFESGNKDFCWKLLKNFCWN